MRCILLLSILLLPVSQVDAFTTHQWSKSFGGPAFDEGEAVAIDGASNVVLVGSASEGLDFGGGPLGLVAASLRSTIPWVLTYGASPLWRSR